MGRDIYGWIEVQDHLDRNWVGAVKIDSPIIVYDRNEPMHTFLFGPHAKYKDALAASRGIPNDISQEFKQMDAIQQGHDHSWVGWYELEDIEWLEKSVEAHHIKLKYIRIDTNLEVELSGGWNLIFDLMKLLAEYHGTNKVRLVIGFL